MKILIIDYAGMRFEREADGYWLDGRCITLYRNEEGEDTVSNRPIAAFWDIKGYEALEEDQMIFESGEAKMETFTDNHSPSA